MINIKVGQKIYWDNNKAKNLVANNGNTYRFEIGDEFEIVKIHNFTSGILIDVSENNRTYHCCSPEFFTTNEKFNSASKLRKFLDDTIGKKLCGIE